MTADDAQEPQTNPAPGDEPSPPAAKTADDAPEPEAPAEEDAPKPIALVVEDSKLIRRMLCQHLTQLGLEVVEAENGRQALKYLVSTTIEECKLILLDVMMPEMDGLEFLRTAKERFDSDLPLVMVCTTKGDRNVVKALLAAGARDYIIKPFKTEVLHRKLREHNILGV